MAWFLGETPQFILTFGQHETLRVKLLFDKVLEGLPNANNPVISLINLVYAST